MTNETPNTKPRRRWYQFSMRTLLLVMLVVVVWVGIRVEWARTNRERVGAVVTAVTEIEKLGGKRCLMIRVVAMTLLVS